jgi:hypothetical protein
MYAKQRYPRPTISEEAKTMLNQFYVGVRMTHGSPRIRETIYRIAQNIAKLKLKDEVDASDAKETIDFYNIILQQLDKVVTSPTNPRESAYNECVNVLMESPYPRADEEMFKTACERNAQVGAYIGKSFKLDKNKKLRPILEMLQNHSRIKIVQMKPIVLQYMPAKDGSDSGTHYPRLSDPTDLSDLNLDTHVKSLDANEDQKIGTDMSDHGSDKSDKSDRVPRYIPGGNGNGRLLRCYYCDKNGSIFETNNESEYFKHGNQKHLNKPMYPNMATIQKYGLMPQGKEWEI